MRSIIFTFDILIGLYALIFVILFITAPINDLNRVILDIQLNRQISDLFMLFSKKEVNISQIQDKIFVLEGEFGGECFCQTFRIAKNSSNEVFFDNLTLCINT